MHRRGIEPSIIVTVAQSVTSRPRMLADIELGSDVLFIGSRNLYTLKTAVFWSRKSIHGIAEDYIRILARKVKQRHKIAFLFRFHIKIDKIHF